MAITKTARTLVASVSSAASGTERGTLDLSGKYGGLLTFKITNGATGPATQCVCSVLVAHNASTPAAASAGTDWKTLTAFGGGLVPSQITEQVVEIPMSVMQLEVEFTGHTTQPVTVEAFLSEVTTV